ncbi:hypothetical protein D3C80_769790 [compost metagenome]
MHFFVRHFDRHRQTNQRANGHGEQRHQRRMVARPKQRFLHPRNIVEHQHADNGHHGNGERRKEQSVTQTFSAAFTLFLLALMIAAKTHAAETGDQRQPHHRNAHRNVHGTLITYQLIGPVTQQEHQAVNAPEHSGRHAARVSFIAK